MNFPSDDLTPEERSIEEMLQATATQHKNDYKKHISEIKQHTENILAIKEQIKQSEATTVANKATPNTVANKTTPTMANFISSSQVILTKEEMNKLKLDLETSKTELKNSQEEALKSMKLYRDAKSKPVAAALNTETQKPLSQLSKALQEKQKMLRELESKITEETENKIDMDIAFRKGRGGFQALEQDYFIRVLEAKSFISFVTYSRGIGERKEKLEIMEKMSEEYDMLEAGKEKIDKELKIIENKISEFSKKINRELLPPPKKGTTKEYVNDDIIKIQKNINKHIKTAKDNIQKIQNQEIEPLLNQKNQLEENFKILKEQQKNITSELEGGSQTMTSADFIAPVANSERNPRSALASVESELKTAALKHDFVIQMIRARENVLFNMNFEVQQMENKLKIMEKTYKLESQTQSKKEPVKSVTKDAVFEGSLNTAWKTTQEAWDNLKTLQEQEINFDQLIKDTDTLLIDDDDLLKENPPSEEIQIEDNLPKGDTDTPIKEDVLLKEDLQSKELQVEATLPKKNIPSTASQQTQEVRKLLEESLDLLKIQKDAWSTALISASEPIENDLAIEEIIGDIETQDAEILSKEPEIQKIIAKIQQEIIDNEKLKLIALGENKKTNEALDKVSLLLDTLNESQARIENLPVLEINLKVEQLNLDKLKLQKKPPPTEIAAQNTTIEKIKKEIAKIETEKKETTEEQRTNNKEKLTAEKEAASVQVWLSSAKLQTLNAKGFALQFKLNTEKIPIAKPKARQLANKATLALTQSAKTALNPQWNPDQFKENIEKEMMKLHEINIERSKHTAKIYEQTEWTPDVSISQRREFFNHTVTLANQHPWFGFGTGSFKTVYGEHVRANQLEKTNNPHGEYLNIYFQLGIMGLVGIVVLFGMLLKISFQLPRPERLVSQGLLVAIGIGCLANSWLMDFTAGYFFVLFTALCFGAWQKITGPS